VAYLVLRFLIDKYLLSFSAGLFFCLSKPNKASNKHHTQKEPTKLIEQYF